MPASPSDSPEKIKDANTRYHDVAAESYDSKWGIDFGPIAPGDRPGQRALPDHRRELSTAPGREFLGIAKTGDRLLRIQDHGRGHDRAGQRSASRLVDARDGWGQEICLQLLHGGFESPAIPVL